MKQTINLERRLNGQNSPKIEEVISRCDLGSSIDSQSEIEQKAPGQPVQVRVYIPDWFLICFNSIQMLLYFFFACKLIMGNVTVPQLQKLTIK